MMKFMGILFYKIKLIFTSWLSTFSNKKIFTVFVICFSFLFIFLLALCSNSNSGKINEDTLTLNHTEIASTIYAEIYMHTEIAATIFAQITPNVCYTPIPTLDLFTNVLLKYPCDNPDFIRIQGQVSKVLDMDKVEMITDGVYKTIRYLGLDSSTDIESSLTSQAQLAALLKNQELVSGREIMVLSDNSTDNNGNLFGYVFTTDSFVNLEMVNSGLFMASLNDALFYSSLFIEAENLAKKSQLGIWAIPTSTATLRAINTLMIPTSTSVPALNCHPSYPDVCIPYPPPDLDCDEIPYRRFRVLPPDPHGFDRDHDGIGCES